MLVYSFMAILSCFFAFLANKVSGKKSKIMLFILVFLPLFCVSAFRYNVGQDYVNTYVYTFNRILHGASNVRIDYGFFLLNKIIIIFSGSYQWVFILSSLIINYFICKSIYDQSKDKFLSVFIYIFGTLFFFTLNGVRQSMALALFYYSLKYIEKNKMKEYFFINFIGFLFHNSAIIFFPLYFIIGNKFNLKYKILIIAFMSIILPTLLPILSNILLNTKYSMYLTNGAYNPLSTINVSTIINILLFVYYEIISKKKGDKDKKLNIYSNIHFIGIIVSFFTTKISLAMRIFMYFRYIEFLSVPFAIEKTSIAKGYKTIFKLLIICIYILYFIHGVYMENGNNVLPYNSCFFK